MLKYFAAFAAAFFLFPAVASSQSPDPGAGPQSPSETPSEPSPSQPARHMNVVWRDGLAFESDDGAYQVQVGAFIRFDGRFVPDDPQHNPSNTFQMAALRPGIRGRIAKYFTFRLIPDVSGGSTTVADAYIDIEFSNAFHVRFGREKVPIGMESMLQDSNVVFLNRGLTINLMPVRDTGVRVYGDLHGGVVSYSAALYNGQVDGADNNSNTTDTNNGKDIVARLAVQPFKKGVVKPLQQLTLAFGASSGDQGNAPLLYLKTSAGEKYFSYAAGAIGDGERTRLTPQMSYYFKRFGGYAEYVRSRQGVSRGAVSADVANRAWQVVGSVLLTHETAGERIHPLRSFDPPRHNWGALQLTARYGSLSIDPVAFTLGLADSSASPEVQVATVGANWYLTTNVKTMFNVERSVFDRDPDGPRRVEHALLFRMQLNF
jgi:phosphate-selective porin OprO and OprP